MRWFRILLLVGVALYLLTGLVEVRRGERAVVRRFGRVLEEKPEAGLWVGLPWGMDRVDRVVVDQVGTGTVGYNEGLGGRGVATGQVLAGVRTSGNGHVDLLYRLR